MTATEATGGTEARLRDVIDIVAGIQAGSPLAALRGLRPNLVAHMQASCDAVIVPEEPGGLPHDLRMALACRIAGQNGDAELDAHYRAMLETQPGARRLAAIADGALPAAQPADIAALVMHSDLLSTHPKDARRSDIEALTAAGVSDADIVRLSELVALVSFQLRVIAGLRALGTER